MKQAVAFFDVDGTVLKGVIELAFVWFLVLHGQVGIRVFVWTIVELLHPKQEGITSRIRANKGYLRGKTYNQIAPSISACSRWALQRIYLGARKEVARLRSGGTHVVLLSASFEFLLSDLKRELGADETIGAKPEVSDGRFTGRLIPPQPYGSGKVEYAKRILDRSSVNSDECIAFGNARADIPLLSYVGERVAVNPSRLLFRYATRLKWPIVRW